ncbi:MBL fold metallo-hydrolase [Flavobacteriaceae bacterium S356]|uniref:MBL fold metallo-hydrolase n=1 Tax=Asprobacillus argus TaxID=3076534 RepID=A0ABU3LF48_9FLAO|nr:MBL fold metallo-hydrolase [Flavobacteriaceae bacterium S356]
MKKACILFLLILWSCHTTPEKIQPTSPQQYITVLGTAQDAGYPHIGCQRACCANFYNGTQQQQRVVSLGLVDKVNQQKWLFEATPDISTQLADLEKQVKKDYLIDGIFLTHAHIGHYTGLMYFGKEALGKKNTKVYAMPKMKSYLETNGPWSQLVALNNIKLSAIENDSTITLNSHLKVTPFIVPHRDEFSETVGYKIQGPNKTALFIPDINKWSVWKKDIVAEVKNVDYAFLDATFFKNGEINRPMSEIPHPFIEETVALFQNETKEVKNKVIFIHFNHTNPVLQPNAKEKKALENLGFRFAVDGQVFEL